MRGLICGTAALALAGPAGAMQLAMPEPATAPPQAQPVVTAPSWVRLPTADELARLYPQTAASGNISGRVRMSCRVQVDGKLTACTILEECPAGFGFGRATLQSAVYFQMRPKTVDGVPVEGGRVVIPLNWRLSGGGVPASCQAAPMAPPPIPVPPKP